MRLIGWIIFLFIIAIACLYGYARTGYQYLGGPEEGVQFKQAEGETPLQLSLCRDQRRLDKHGNPVRREYVLARDWYVCRNATGDAYKVPKGFVTDFASVPWYGRAAADTENSIEAAILHDWLYAVGEDGLRKEADQIFLEELKANGVNSVARSIMHRSVRLGGGGAYGREAEWRFRDGENSCREVNPPFDKPSAPFKENIGDCALLDTFATDSRAAAETGGDADIEFKDTALSGVSFNDSPRPVPVESSAIEPGLTRAAVDARLNNTDAIYAAGGLQACSGGDAFQLTDRSTAGPRKFAILAGINDYVVRELKLNWSLYDVYKMGRYADEAGFDYIHYVTGDKVTPSRMDAAVDCVAAQARPEDQVLVYFSGHGEDYAAMEFNSAGQLVRDEFGAPVLITPVGYLPTKSTYVNAFAEGGADITDAAARARAERWDDDETVIEMAAILHWSNALRKVRQAAFILDSCFSGLAGYAERRFVALAASDRPPAPFAHRLYASGAYNQLSRASETWNGSLFTDIMVHALSPDSGVTGAQTGAVSGLDLQSFVYRAMAATPPSIDRRFGTERIIRQTPYTTHLFPDAVDEPQFIAADIEIDGPDYSAPGAMANAGDDLEFAGGSFNARSEAAAARVRYRQTYLNDAPADIPEKFASHDFGDEPIDVEIKTLARNSQYRWFVVAASVRGAPEDGLLAARNVSGRLRASGAFSEGVDVELYAPVQGSPYYGVMAATFTTRPQADEILARVKTAGFADAYLWAWDGKKKQRYLDFIQP